MSKLETNTIDTISGSTSLQIGSTNTNTITLGTSGDTITVPTGVSLTVPSGGLSGQNYPAFQACITTNQSIPNTTYTKVQFQTEVFDTDNTYDAVTNHRFTPGVAGKYLITASVGIDSMIDTRYSICNVYKNGSVTGYADSKARRSLNHAPVASTLGSLISFIDTANDTDYYEVFVFHNYGSARNTSTAYYGFFGAYRIGD